MEERSPGIEPKHRRVLEINLSRFAERTHEPSRLISFLHATKLISDQEHLQLEGEVKGVYELMMRRDGKEFGVFLRALLETGNDEIAKEIESGMDEEEDDLARDETRVLIEKIFAPLERLKSNPARPSKKKTLDISLWDSGASSLTLKDICISVQGTRDDLVFTQLETLTLTRCRVDEVLFEVGTKDRFPALKVLIIDGCCDSRGFPLVSRRVQRGIEGLPSLQTYVLDGANVPFTGRRDCIERIDRHYMGVLLGIVLTSVFFWLIGLTEIFGFGLCKCPIDLLDNSTTTLEPINDTSTTPIDYFNIN